MMLQLAKEYPEYRDAAQKVKIVETTSAPIMAPGIRTCRTVCPRSPTPAKKLGWKPSTTMADTLRNIFDAYRSQIVEARGLVD